jgi:transposase
MDMLPELPCPKSLHYAAPSEVGAENWALLSSIVATCRLNDVNPVDYLAETLTAIINGHPQARIDDLMPWRFGNASTPAS